MSHFHLHLAQVILLIFSTHLSQGVGSYITRALITSPTHCLSDLECPRTHNCPNFYDSPPNNCAPRRGLNSQCDDNGDCQDGLYCPFIQNFKKRVCVKKIPLGGACRRVDESPCVDGSKCSPKTRECIAESEVGRLGSPCTAFGQCDVNGGFYCNDNKRSCQRRERAGTPCKILDGAYRCAGFCAGINSQEGGVCVDALPDGAPCQTYEHCRISPLAPPHTDDAVCNIPSGDTGICVRESKLITHLGARCNPSADFCDARRGLSCREQFAGRETKGKTSFVCQHRPTKESGNFPYCVPGSPLSACVQEEFPTVCRRSMQRLHVSDDFYQCRRTVEVLPRGSICGRDEYTKCEGGTSCIAVPGLEPILGRHSPRPLETCIQIVGDGEACGNKFTTQCSDDHTCSNGTCKKGDSDPANNSDTHAQLHGDCNVLPCPPGSVCVKPETSQLDSTTSTCELPLIVAKIGEPCFEKALFRTVSSSHSICIRIHLLSCMSFHKF